MALLDRMGTRPCAGAGRVAEATATIAEDESEAEDVEGGAGGDGLFRDGFLARHPILLEYMAQVAADTLARTLARARARTHTHTQLVCARVPFKLCAFRLQRGPVPRRLASLTLVRTQRSTDPYRAPDHIFKPNRLFSSSGCQYINRLRPRPPSRPSRRTARPATARVNRRARAAAGAGAETTRKGARLMGWGAMAGARARGRGCRGPAQLLGSRSRAAARSGVTKAVATRMTAALARILSL